MKISNKVSIIMYGLAMFSSLGNTYFAYKNENIDATIVWVCASGLASGGLGAHLKIKELKDEEDGEE
jgi:hypothetical protein